MIRLELLWVLRRRDIINIMWVGEGGKKHSIICLNDVADDDSCTVLLLSNKQ